MSDSARSQETDDDTSEEGDRILRIVGIVLVVGILIALSLMVLAGMNSSFGASDPPIADWNVSRVNESYIQIAHRGGDPVKTEKLVITVNGRVRQVSWTDDDTISRGDSTVLRVSEGRVVRLFWKGQPGNRNMLYRERVGNTTG